MFGEGVFHEDGEGGEGVFESEGCAFFDMEIVNFYGLNGKLGKAVGGGLEVGGGFAGEAEDGVEGDGDAGVMEGFDRLFAAGPVVSAVDTFEGGVVDGLNAEFDPDFDVAVEFGEKVDGLGGDAVGAGADADGGEGKLVE